MRTPGPEGRRIDKAAVPLIELLRKNGKTRFFTKERIFF